MINGNMKGGRGSACPGLASEQGRTSAAAGAIFMFPGALAQGSFSLRAGQACPALSISAQLGPGRRAGRALHRRQHRHASAAAHVRCAGRRSGRGRRPGAHAGAARPAQGAQGNPFPLQCAEGLLHANAHIKSFMAGSERQRRKFMPTACFWLSASWFYIYKGPALSSTALALAMLPDMHPWTV